MNLPARVDWCHQSTIWLYEHYQGKETGYRREDRRYCRTE